MADEKEKETSESTSEDIENVKPACEELDIRVEFISTFVLKMFKFKPEKWQKMIQSDDKHTLIKFVDSTSLNLLTFCIGQTGLLQVTIGFPTTTSYQRNKIVYFVRQMPQVINSENIRSVLVSGVISNDLVNELTVFTDEILCPLLCNPNNHFTWPEVIISDVKKHVMNFKNNLCRISGDIYNQVILPMPDGIEHLNQAEESLLNSNGEKIDVYLKTNIEGVVIQWAMQINKVLKENSSTIFEKKKFSCPIDDIGYWVTRLKNLQGIYNQLRNIKVKKMVCYLEMTNSVYLHSFKSTLTSLIAGIVEARDIVIHQKPLVHRLETFEKTNFIESKPLYRPFVHCIGLLWSASRYYRRTEKIIVFLQCTANMIIQQSTIACGHKNIFHGEPFENVVKINQILSVIDYFLNVYENKKQTLSSHFSEDVVVILWNFENVTVFFRLFEFMKRLKMVKEILQTTVEMSKLEKVEFAGIRGKMHSEKTKLIFEKYDELYSKLCDIEYDPLNTEEEQFIKDYKRFSKKIIDIDYCLAKLFGEAFDDSPNIEYNFKLLQIIGDLAFRPRIKNELQPRYDQLFYIFHKELLTVEEMFIGGLNIYEKANKRPMIDTYFPPVAGFLWWIYKLRQRINTPMNEFNQNEFLTTYSKLLKDMQNKYDEIILLFNESESKYFNEWSSKVPEICAKCMDTPLLKKGKVFLKLNFSNELVCLLREIKYLKYLNAYSIPEEGITLFEKKENLMDVTHKLNRIVEWYNKIQNDSHQSELILISSELSEINELLKNGFDKVHWNADNDKLNNYTNMVYTKIDALQKRVLLAQNNIEQVFGRIQKWSNAAMYDRQTQSKTGKNTNVLIDENHIKKTKRFNDINSSCVEIQKSLKENYRLYFNISLDNSEHLNKLKENEGDVAKDFSNENEKLLSDSFNNPQFESAWLQYIDFIDLKVCNCLTDCIIVSLRVLLSNMDLNKSFKFPFMEINCDLKVPNITFSPSLDESEDDLLSIVQNMISDIIHQAKIFKRISKQNIKEDYFSEIENDSQIVLMKNKIYEIIKITIADIKTYIQIYDKYAYLWLEDHQEFLQLFLKFGQVISPDKIYLLDIDEMEKADDFERPSLEQFKSQINIFEDLYKQCENLPETQTFYGWLFLNMKSLKQSLLNNILKWGNTLKEELVNFVVNKLSDLDSFIENTSNTLSIELQENDYEGLLKVMDCLINIRENQETTADVIFEPLKEHIEFLKTYSVEFPEETYSQDGKKKHSVYTLLEVLPEKWRTLLKQSAVIKNNVAPFKVNQAHLITKQLTHFNSRMQHYRNNFKHKKFFSLECEDVYGLIDKTHSELNHFEEIIFSLNKSCELFDVPVLDSKPIVLARKELKMAKQIWDYYFLVEYTIEDWKKTPWKNIDAEAMDVECKRFTKDLKSLDKEIRCWDPYLAIESIIKNLLTSLRAVTELQNPAIRERHWIELMQATKNESEMKNILTKLKGNHICTCFNHSYAQLHETTNSSNETLEIENYSHKLSCTYFFQNTRDVCKPLIENFNYYKNKELKNTSFNNINFGSYKSIKTTNHNKKITEVPQLFCEHIL